MTDITFAAGNFGSPMQILIIAIIVLILFGGSRLRNIGGDLGNAIKGFKKAMSDGDKAKEEEQAKQENKTVDKKVDETETDATFNYNKNWKTVKTPKGKILGEQNVDDLIGFKDALEERGKTENNPLYDAVLSGIQDMTNPQGDDAEF